MSDQTRKDDGRVRLRPPTAARGTHFEARSRLLPTPRRVAVRDDELTLRSGMELTYGPDGPEVAAVAEALARTLGDEWNVRLTPRASKRIRRPMLRVGSPEPRLSRARIDDDRPEGYVLKIGPSGAAMRSATAAGLRWATQTFGQLIAVPSGRPTVGACAIRDWPRYRWRGFMIDSGRCPNSPAKIRRILRICSAMKLNMLLFREGDDERCAVRYETNRLGRHDHAALSMNEIDELIDYAAALGVAFVPEIESLGHSAAKAAYYPELVEGGIITEYEGLGTHTRKSHLLPGDPRTLELLESVYREWFARMPSPLVHLGLDEVRLPAETQAAHMEKLLSLVFRVADDAGRDVLPIVWADAPPTPPEFVGRVARCLWSYANQGTCGPDNEKLASEGLESLGAPGCREPVFLAGGSASKHTPHTRDEIDGVLRNLASYAAWGRGRANVRGLLAVQWSGNMTDDWLEDFAAAAEYAWHPPAGEPDLAADLGRIRYRLGRLEDAANPHADQIDPPCWDNILLRNGRFHRDLRTGATNPDA